jgi:hypothetical protein
MGAFRSHFHSDIASTAANDSTASQPSDTVGRHLKYGKKIASLGIDASSECKNLSQFKVGIRSDSKDFEDE